MITDSTMIDAILFLLCLTPNGVYSLRSTPVHKKGALYNYACNTRNIVLKYKILVPWSSG